MEDNKLVFCGRYVADPYNDKVEERKGIDLGVCASLASGVTSYEFLLYCFYLSLSALCSLSPVYPTRPPLPGAGLLLGRVDPQREPGRHHRGDGLRPRAAGERCMPHIYIYICRSVLCV